MRWVPDYPQVDLSPLLDKSTLTQEDYDTLLAQTGLGADAVRKLYALGDSDKLEQLQALFFDQPAVLCAANTIVSSQETVVTAEASPTPGTQLAPLEDGDILVSPCCHTFGWRNGHAALVLNAQEGITLESVVLGQNSCLQNVDKWTYYPAFLVLRLKDASPETRRAIASNAAQKLLNIPYSLGVGVFSPKFTQSPVLGTHCAHLVWQAYAWYGYDLDSSGGSIVTPQDLAQSPLLEVVQVFGIDPETRWEGPFP